MNLPPEEFERRALSLRDRPMELGRFLESTFLGSEAYKQFPAARADIRHELVTVVQGYQPNSGQRLFDVCLSQLVRICDEVASRHGVELDYLHVHVGVAAGTRVFRPPPPGSQCHLGEEDSPGSRSRRWSVFATALVSLPLSAVAFGPLLIIGAGSVCVAGIRRITATTSSARRSAVGLGTYGLAILIGPMVTFSVALVQTN